MLAEQFESVQNQMMQIHVKCIALLYVNQSYEQQLKIKCKEI